MTKSLTWLLDAVLDESSTRCDTDTRRDKITVSRRVEHEGMSFLTITLPAFCSDFERCLADGCVTPERFLGFKKHLSLPRFVSGLMSQVFDPKSGRLLARPSEEAVLCIRQVCLMHKKVELPCSETRTRKAFDGYKQVEHDLADPAGAIRESDLFRFTKASAMLWPEVLGALNRSIENSLLLPRHGPGATAERISGNRKYLLRRWHSRLQQYFPFDQFGLASLNQVDGAEVEGVEFVEPDAEMPVRVITVPKTLKTPRIIAIEPVCMQYTQQALMEEMVRSIESSRSVGGRVNFSDQTINRKLALDSSISGKYATLDLSDASDRVSLDLVERLLASAPNVLGAVLACRSTRAKLPTGEVLSLRKFASMGSALCFPIEAMVFYTICCLSRLEVLGLPLTSNNLRKVGKEVYVYGDDIIVPSDEVSAVAEKLEVFNLKVNPRKTFGTGRFRESCGMDAFNGVDVTPVYVRRSLPSNRRNAPELISTVSLANQLYKKGWWLACRKVREKVEAILGPLPVVRETAPCLGWHTLGNGYSVSRWNSKLHRFEVKGWIPTVRKQPDLLDGWAALMKFFLKRGTQTASRGHLEHSVVRSACTALKLRSATPF